MNKSIKNFIEEGEKEFDEKFCTIYDTPVFVDRGILKETYPLLNTKNGNEIKQFISSRQISLIKMIVEMVESGKVKRLGLNNKMKDDRFHDRLEINHDISVHNQALDTISSKLKELTDGK